MRCLKNLTDIIVFFVGWWLVVLEEVSFINSGSQTISFPAFHLFFQQLPIILDVLIDELLRIAICGIFLTSVQASNKQIQIIFPMHL